MGIAASAGDSRTHGLVLRKGKYLATEPPRRVLNSRQATLRSINAQVHTARYPTGLIPVQLPWNDATMTSSQTG